MKFKYLNVLGIMSGTSMDGIDISFVKTNGIELERYNKNFYFPFNKILKNALSDTLKNDKKYKFYKKNQFLNNLISQEYLKAIFKTNILFKCDLIGIHGQTIYHNPKKNSSIQLGNAQLISNKLNKPVIFNFRQLDIENGGEGAPISAIYHKLLIDKLKIHLPACIINIGGISNLTFWDGFNLISFDTGPGNVLIDKYTKEKLNQDYDKNGEIASRGKACTKVLDTILKDLYFKKKYPKSLDIKYFDEFYELIMNCNLNIQDTLATLTNLTSLSIELGLKLLPRYPKNIIICGGGFKNDYLMKKLKKNKQSNFIDINFYIPNITDFMESELMAYLTARSYYRLPITFPTTTGVKKPVTGGELFKPIKNL